MPRLTQSERPVRVVHLVSRQQRRGAETVAVELADEMTDHGIVSDLVGLAMGQSGAAVELIVPLSTGARIDGLALVPIIWRLRRKLRGRQFDVVLAHGGQAALVAVLASAGLNVPVVWQRILEFPPQALRRPRRWLWAFVARRVAAAVAITPHVSDEVRRLGFGGPVEIVPNHRRWARFAELDKASCRANLCREIGCSIDEPVIGFVGHLVDQKRPQLAVEVLRRLDRDDVRLVIAGDGPLREEVAVAAATAGLHGRVHMLGHREDVPELLAAIDCLVVTSASETMTGTVVEAQMAGCPVVSFRLDGIDTVVADGVTGIIVECDDVGGAASAVEKLLADPVHRGRMAANARAQGALFSTEEAAQRYAKLLRHVTPGAARKPRVLFLMPNFGVGGAERALYLIACHADRGEFVPLVASLGPPRRPESETVLPDLRALGVPLHDLGLTARADRSPRELLRGARRLRSLCRQLDIDVVDSCLFEADLVARLALIRTDVRHVVHLVNTPYDKAVAAHSRGRARWRLQGVRSLDAISGRLTESFVAITEAVAKAAERDLAVPTRKLEVIPRGVDLDRFPPQPTQRDETRPLAVLSVGRLVPQKGHAIAIEAVRQARVEGADLRYTIVGEGPLRDELAGLITAAGLDDVVELREPTRHVSALHAEHDVFCFPSLWEGQGNALIEAMASSRPVVASDIAPLREVLGEPGLFAQPGNAEDLARILTDLSRWPSNELARAGAALRARAETLFAAPTQSERLGALYRRICDGGGIETYPVA